MPEHAWERQEGETATAYGAFEHYRRLGPGRSLQAAWEQYFTRPGTRQQRGNREARHFPGYWARWSARWRWQARVAAWDEQVAALARDQELDRELRARVEQQEEEIRQRQLMREEARAARAVGRRGLLRILQEIEGQKLDTMGLAELIPHLKKFLEAVAEGQRLERLEQGEPTEITAWLSTGTADAIARVIERYVPEDEQEAVAAQVDAALGHVDSNGKPESAQGARG